MNFLTLRRSKTTLSSLSSLLRTQKPQFSPFHPPPPHQNPHQNLYLIRSFYTSRSSQNLQHFRRRPGAGGAHWYRNPRVVLAVTIVSGAAAVSVYYGNLETVPYTKRSHFVLLSPSFERQLGEAQFEELKKQLKPKILPSIHPDSIRVRLIAKEIIGAVERGIGRNGGGNRWTDAGFSAVDWGMGGEGGVGEDEVLDDRWVRESRRMKGGTQAETKHLEGLQWEVLVVRDGMVNAFCLPGGKIVVFTGLLDHFRSDAEIATVIGHEVGHAIARHAAEGITRNFWFALLQLIILQFFYMPEFINMMSNLLLRLPFSRRMEMEADYIGLLLLASAGYDPRVAPKVYEKLGQITGDSALRDYLSTHPSSKKRALLLSKAEVMSEALAIYRESIAGQGVAGFL